MKKHGKLPVRVIAEDDYICAYLREQLSKCHGLTLCDPETASSAVIATDSALSAAERRVLRMLLEHDKISEAANALYLSQHTIKKHLENIYKKLGVHSLHRAIIIAYRAGWLEDKSMG